MDRHFLGLTYNREKIKEIEQLCAPFFDVFPVETFGYRKFFFDGSYISLSNNLPWQEYYFSNVKTPGNIFGNAIKGASSDRFSFFVWPQYPKDSIFQALYDHDIWHGVTVYYRGKDFVESFAFATKRNAPELINFLNSNYIESLKKFILYFKNSGRLLLDTYPKEAKGNFETFTPVINQYTKKNQGYMNVKTNSCLSFLKHIRGGSISPREWECLDCLSKGLMTKEIASQLNLSPRTVETHLNKVKNKYNLSRKTQLVHLYQQIKKDFY